MENNTKTKILDAALELFSKKGYDGTSMQDIADSLHLSKTALYRHYKSKDDIFDSLINDVEAYYSWHISSRFTPIPDSTDELLNMSMRQVNFTVHDKKIIRIRKFLAQEQFRNGRIAKLATAHFLSATEEMYTAIFAAMEEKNLLIKCDPRMLAFEYTAPVGALISLCDREPDKTNDTLSRIREYFQHFINIYGIKNTDRL